MSVTNEQISVGVQQLIEKLRSQGVSSGRTEGERLIEQARDEAARIVAEAKKEAESITSKAKKEADFTIKSGEESLELAGRNAVLELKAYLMEKFSNRIGEAVTSEMQNQGILQSMILEVAGRSSLKAESNIEAILPSKVVGVDDLRANPEELKEGTLAYFVARNGMEMLKDGVTFEVSNEQKSGVTFRLNDKNIEVELDDAAVSEMLLKHLQPRFRALLEGTIK
ncbi:ATPase [Parendozoicomonas sp. Alg238-R29]|uniref:ATPase n=1 Tax=Parendozoicomonas sp. Alg238-R29 TaxID=2993446 RepID=UPI00248E9236|nr:ATPase [Parendozoicomonas sp. Alg238-R29]